MAKYSDPPALALPISFDTLAFAHEVTAPLAQDAIAHRVFGNAVAVATLHHFFAMLGIPSNYRTSALLDPIMQLAADISDLYVSPVGQLECRSIAPDQQTVIIPEEGQSDRIGYAFVSYDLECRRATIHGFLPQSEMGPIPRERLRSVEFMLQYLDALTVPRLSLTRWLSGLFDPGWVPVESITLSQRPAFRALGRPPISRLRNATHGGQVRLAKQLVWPDCDIYPAPSPILLVIEASQIAPLTMRASVQVHPGYHETHLMSNLILLILDQAGTQMMKATARTMDNYLQLQFKGTPGEIFQVQVILAEQSIVENFQL